MFQMSAHAHVDELVKMKIAFVYTLYKKNSYFFRGTKMKTLGLFKIFIGKAKQISLLTPRGNITFYLKEIRFSIKILFFGF